MTADASVRRALDRAAAAVAGDGVDPERLARVVGWCTRDGESADGLRRRLLGRSDQLALEDTDPVDTDPVAAEPAGPAAFDAVVPDLTRDLYEPTATHLAAWARDGVRVATVVDEAYPAALARGWPHVDAPPFVAWRGAATPVGHAVAIVGARRATAYGTGVAAWLAEAAGRAGVRVVSGGALGVDAASHLAAVDTLGGTTVVLGCGHAVDYPRPHAAPDGLFDRIVAAGGTVLSEQLPTGAPRPGNVRARNRIVAALADAVVVVEGGGRSGALVTATAAADRGVPVLAVPGDVRAPGSVAPHRLLAEGAAPCTSPADLLAALGTAAAGDDPATGDVARDAVRVLPDDVHRVLAAAWPRPVTVDDLATATGRPAPVLLGALTRARIAGETADDATGVRLRRAPT